MKILESMSTKASIAVLLPIALTAGCNLDLGGRRLGQKPGASQPQPDAGKTANPTPTPVPPASLSVRFSDDFENAAKFSDLFHKDLSRWHGTQKDPPENSIELTQEKVHSGKNAVKFFAKARTGSGASKADIERGTFQFKKGDDVWFSGWYFIAGTKEARDIFLWDLEDGTAYQNPGRRVYVQEGECLASDLGKTLFGPTFRQDRGKEKLVPREKWFQVKVHLFLSEGRDGWMEVWQDGVKIIDGKGQTLPSARSVYDRLQVGLTANGNANNDHTVYLDDIAIGKQQSEI